MTEPARRSRAPLPLLGAMIVLLAGCAGPAAMPSADPTPERLCAPGAQVVGDTPADLQRALDEAVPGTVLQLADTTYTGDFVITSSGTADDPIRLCGSGATTLDGGDMDRGTVLMLDGASHWELSGFAVTGGSTGITLDASSDNVLHDLEVARLGHVGIHLRGGSSRNIIRDSAIADTGLTNADHGEGIYVGSAQSNWCRYSACEPDASDENRILRTTIGHTAAEAIDVKEGTRGGVIRDNTISRGDGTSSEAVIELRGDDWVVHRNGVGSGPGPGLRISSVAGWGQRNLVAGNTFGGGAAEEVIVVAPSASSGGNVIGCDNTTAFGAAVSTNVPCVADPGRD